MQREITSLCGIIVLVGVVIILFMIEASAPTITKISAGLVLIGTVLGGFFLEKQTKKEVLNELEERIGSEKFQIAKTYLKYRTSLNISLCYLCPLSIKIEVLQYFKDIGFKCNIDY
ncbi:MAG: hypothetical protein V1491_00885 [archaeon]